MTISVYFFSRHQYSVFQMHNTRKLRYKVNSLLCYTDVIIKRGECQLYVTRKFYSSHTMGKTLISVAHKLKCHLSAPQTILVVTTRVVTQLNCTICFSDDFSIFCRHQYYVFQMHTRKLRRGNLITLLYS